MTKVNRVQAVITQDENSQLIKEADLQQRTVSNLIRKYIIDGVKRDKLVREEKK